MERGSALPGCAFRRLWTAWGRASNPSTTTSFMRMHPIEIQENILALMVVHAPLGGGAVGADAGSVGRLRGRAGGGLAPAVEACRRVRALGQGEEGADRVRSGEGGGEQHR